MNWNSFCGVVGDIDNAYMDSLGVLLAGMTESDVFDAWPMLFGYSL
jgi:hypothetical protein